MKNNFLPQVYMASKYFAFGLVLQCFCYSLLTASHSSAQDPKSIKEIFLSIEFEDESLEEVFKRLQSLTDYKFSFNYEDIKDVKGFSARYDKSTLYEILSDLGARTGLSFKQVNFNINVARFKKEKKIEIVIEDVNISGRVTDDEGNPLPGVNVIIKGTTNGTITSADGTYSINAPAQSILVFSFVGFLPEEIPVNNQTTVNISLYPDIMSLEELIVVGYGTVRKSDLTGAVSQVKAQDVNAYPASNVLQSLSGRSAGVQVMQTNGAPGAGLSVRIRGTNSIQGGNEPLYVVDGFPFSGNPSHLNTADINSIEILKDASATAIYGSRGANGVVIITTKQGQAGDTKVDFEASYSIQKLRKKLDLMNAKEYAMLNNIQAANDGLEPYFSEAEVNSFGEGFDWQDLVFQEAPIKMSSLSVRGGNERTQFSVSGGLFQQEGIIKGSDYNRYSLNTNLKHKISEKFSLDLHNTITRLTTARRDNGGGSRGNSMIGAAISAPPLSNPYNEDGSYTILGNEYSFITPDLTNPLNFINEQHSEVKANVVLLNAALLFNPIPEVTIKVSGGLENRDDRSDSYTTRNFLNSEGRASVAASQFRSVLSENTISYNKTLNERHSIGAVAGFTYQDFLYTDLNANGVGYLSDAFESHNLESAATPGIPATEYSKSVLLSYLGRVNYAYNNKYLITASFRADGSSKYSEGDKWGYFPSGAVAWRVSEEDFLNNNGTISDLKLRGSWGLTGSQAINAYATRNQLLSGTTVFGNELYNTFAPGTMLPDDLKWETTEQFDFGMDLGLFNNRLLLTADYYIKNTRDLLNTVTLPSSMGFTTTIRNVGEVQNKGVELGINANILNRNFLWDVDANVAFNKNEVIKLNNGDDVLGGYVAVLVIMDNVSILREGLPMGQFWGYLEDGYDEEGRIKFKDLDENGEINADDKTAIGNPNPDFIFGFNSNMAYKNFELNIFLQGTYGNDIFNASAVPSTLDFGQGLNMPREVFTDHWTPDNTNAKYPLISRNTGARVSDRFVEDGSYLRLKNIQLAYNFPVDKWKVDWLQNAQLYVSGQNLLTLTSYSWWDPEVNSRGAGNLNDNEPEVIQQGIDHYSYPISKVVTVGVRVGF